MCARRSGGLESLCGGGNKLRRRGPYWDGTFANNWIVQPGSRAIRPIIPTMPNVAASPRPAQRRQELDLPPSPNLGGYTLGNRTTYRIYAMDLAPSGVWGNIYRGETGQTSPDGKFWYTRYINNVMPKTIDGVFRDVLRGSNDSAGCPRLLRDPVILACIDQGVPFVARTSRCLPAPPTPSNAGCR